MFDRTQMIDGITMRRLRGGVPGLWADSLLEATRGLGYMHAVDRGVQMELSRLLAMGRASEHFGASPALVRIDTAVRRLGLYLYPQMDLSPLSASARELLEAYVDGVNRGWKARGAPMLFRLLRYRRARWTTADVVRVMRFTAFFGLASGQASFEDNVVDLVRRGVPVEALRELVGEGIDGVDPDLVGSVAQDVRSLGLGGVAGVAGSNAWALAGSKTGSRHPIIANDPHMDVGRLPALWYEVELHVPGESVAGATCPGLPSVLFGRNLHLGWAMTYAHADGVDHWVEECKDGKRRVGPDAWEPMRERVEVIRPRGKAEQRFSVFMSPHGVLLGDARRKGRYLSVRWVGEPGRFASTIEAALALPRARSVAEARAVVRGFHFPPTTWVFADDAGHIGTQVSGAFPKRPSGWSGLYPVPGWTAEHDWDGLVDPETLPGETDPDRGFVVAANQHQRIEGGPALMNAALPPYRLARIGQCLTEEDNWSLDGTQQLQCDLHSVQAERLVPLFLEYARDPEILRELGTWSLRVTPTSRAATIFENLYRAAILTVFGDGGVGRETTIYLLDETGFFFHVHHRVEDVLLDRQSVWFRGRDYDTVLREAMAEGEAAPYEAWGDRNVVTHANPLFGRVMGRLTPVNRGPFGFPGNHATVQQGAVVREGGLVSHCGPSYRFVSDLGTDELWTNLPGGPSEHPLSRFYATDLGRWRFGEYKRLQLVR